MVNRVPEGSREGGRFAPENKGKENLPTIKIYSGDVASKNLETNKSIEDIYAKYLEDNLKKKESEPGLIRINGDKYTFLLRNIPYGEDLLEAYLAGQEPIEGKEVGYIRWYGRDDGAIGHIEVKPEYRRRGIATELYQRASILSLDIGLHSPKHNAVRSKEGDAWAISMGMPLPPLACETCGELGHYGESCGVNEELFIKDIQKEETIKDSPIIQEFSAIDLMKRIRLNPWDALETSDGEWESVEEVMSRKAIEVDESGLAKSIRENGLQEPIVLQDKGTYLNLFDGHHRLAIYLRDHPSKPILIRYTD